MNKRNWILLFLLLGITYFAKATEVQYRGVTPSKTKLVVTNVRWESFDVFEFTANHRVHKLICGVNPFFDEKKSYLYFKNYYGIDVAKYEMDETSCVGVWKFLQATFEGVSNEDPIIITLDNENFKVEQIILPPLDPLQNEAPAENPADKYDSYAKSI